MQRILRILPAEKASRYIGASGVVDVCCMSDTSPHSYIRDSPYAANSKTVALCRAFVWHQKGQIWSSRVSAHAPRMLECCRQYLICLFRLLIAGIRCRRTCVLTHADAGPQNQILLNIVANEQDCQSTLSNRWSIAVTDDPL